MRRIRRALIAALMGAGAAVTGLAQPAQALTTTDAEPVKWAFVDSADPVRPSPNPAGDALIGSARDAAGVRHTGRVYVTFDIAPYHGRVLHGATLYSRETDGYSCAEPATVQMWRTGPVTDATTWRQRPRDIELVGAHPAGPETCPSAYFGSDVRSLLEAAVARGETTVTFGLRLAPGDERDVRRGRNVERLALRIVSNHKPVITALRLGEPERPCGTLAEPATTGTDGYFRAYVEDKDYDFTTVTHAIWPVGHPEQRAEFPAAYARDLSGYADGTVLAWTARAQDYDDLGDWAPTCHVRVVR